MTTIQAVVVVILVAMGLDIGTDLLVEEAPTTLGLLKKARPG